MAAVTDRSVPSLFRSCTRVVVSSLSHHEDALPSMPMPVKQACLSLMSKRGLITDSNIGKLISDRQQVLDLSASEVSDACLFKLNICRNLRKLDLNSIKKSNEGITSLGITSISHSCPYLQVLYLRRCISLTDEGIVAVSENCPLLRELNVGGCLRLTGASLIALGQNSRNLTSLNISKTRVKDNGIYSLVSGICSASLKELDMSGCTSLTDEAVEAVTHFCKQIKILIFHGCPLMSENTRIALEELMQDGSSRMKQVTFTVY